MTDPGRNHDDHDHVTFRHRLGHCGRAGRAAPGGLDPGEHQRRLRPLATHPDVLLIDEPTTGLDASTATDILAAVRRRLPHAVLVMAMHQTPGNPELPRSAPFTLSLD